MIDLIWNRPSPVIMFLQQCVAINVFVTMFLYIICNNVLVTGYVLLAFGEIA